MVDVVSFAKNHDIERRRAVVKLPRAREKEREEDTVCSVVHIIFSRDVISEIHTRETVLSYVTLSYGIIWDCPCMVVGNRFFATFSPCTETNGSRSSTLSFSACVGTLYKVTPAKKKNQIELLHHFLKETVFIQTQR